MVNWAYRGQNLKLIIINYALTNESYTLTNKSYNFCAEKEHSLFDKQSKNTIFMMRKDNVLFY